ncbi:FAD-linked oxidoreductase afoF [Beauveria bassiana]|uniref:FAD-linked oxidoreductase afoF n=1 Tax=Beauveria bassiana TaxID=176275 RepID=A0A2N6NCH4_BEABA|nr:FAD-linked oxidoreductase afoF [Beauveria bassiana]
MEILPTIIAAAATSACRFPLIAQSALGQRFCPRAVILDEVQDLARRLSPTSQVLLPGDQGFFQASQRWSAFDEPRPGIVVIPGVASDVAATVQYANEHGKPFLAIGGQHGATSTLGKLRGGIGIAMSTLDSVELSADGHTAKVGGGALSKTVIDALWEAGKQTGGSTVVTGTCECVSLVGPGLGGGHGWLQGRHGLIADQFVSMDVVLADGSMRTAVDAHSDPDLWWALRGAGHNFAIVTSVTLRVHDIVHRDWARVTMIFSGDRVEQVFQILHDTIFKNDAQDVVVIVWSYFLRIPELDAENPVVVVYLLQEGVQAVDARHAAALRALDPLSVEDRPGTYRDLAAWTVISAADAPCQKLGAANLRFPLYLEAYDVGAVQRVYDQFAAALRETPAFARSMFLWENYPVQGLRARAAADSAFAFRGDSILVAPLINFPSGDEDAARKAVVLGEALRDTLHNASRRETRHTYVNYAFRDAKEEMYGAEGWRREKLARLKAKYDPHGRFNFYNPVV